ncbi:hypothetical protein [Clostridium beijerinckii]|uniref:hypothetical protein n=1 Tax=Clostridium beijerinckii TaxID=1520 RepID=UPI00098C0FE8|nr:hypothetical protein [Clostridium beijerinckii]MBA8937246.1 hypothetical protein [Clostridium beijerinckii]NRU40288.1 hypothetical protein [Clostridium beijerinckii]NSA96435.1 hypothetical protein [Clostridium beijerinckii]OOM60658.1 hypothetical protein CLOBI_29460 [Clostridium beijerinckii]OOM68580.1 hypothetical protein CLBEIC_32370 [Clostridium beijerinckii]
MERPKRKKLKPNIKFNQEIVVCAKSPSECSGCKECCELIELFYYPFDGKNIKECFKNDERRR